MSILSSALVGIMPNSGRLLVASLSPLYRHFVTLYRHYFIFESKFNIQICLYTLYQKALF